MSVLTFDEIVLGMIAQGVPKERAEATARRELGQSGPIAGAELHGDALEDVHVDAGDKLVRALGGHVVRNSQKRASKVTPGIPDRIMFFPRHRVAAFWEAKRIGGVQSSAQKLFQELCCACGWTYIVGPLSALEAFIVRVGIARNETDGTWTPLPFHPLIEDRP